MEEIENIEYSCTECNSIVGKDDIVCPNCGADLTEIVEDDSEQNNQLRLPRFIKIVAIVFLVLSSLKLLRATTWELGGIIALITGKLNFLFIPRNNIIGHFQNLVTSTVIIISSLDWSVTLILFISSIGLLTKKKWSMKLFIIGLYFNIAINIILILILLYVNINIKEPERYVYHIGMIFTAFTLYFIIASTICYVIIRKLSSKRYKDFPINVIA